MIAADFVLWMHACVAVCMFHEVDVVRATRGKLHRTPNKCAAKGCDGLSTVGFRQRAYLWLVLETDSTLEANLHDLRKPAQGHGYCVRLLATSSLLISQALQSSRRSRGFFTSKNT